MRRPTAALPLTLICLLTGCTPSGAIEEPSSSPSLSPTPTQTPSPTADTEPTSTEPSTADPISPALLDHATTVGLTDIATSDYNPLGADGVTGWWDNMFVALWVTPETDPVPSDAPSPIGEMDLDDITATRHESGDALMATFTCGDLSIVTGILGTDDDVIGTDPLLRYTQAARTALC